MPPTLVTPADNAQSLGTAGGHRRYRPGVEPPTTPPRDHSLRTGLLLAAGVVVLAVAILVVAVVVVLHRVGDGVATATRDVGPDNPGAPDRLTLEEGRAFTFHDQRFAAGWKLVRSGGEQVVGVSHCHSKDTLEPGSPNTMICTGVVTDGAPIDRLEVADFRLSP
jgi:hypothetical protein